MVQPQTSYNSERGICLGALEPTCPRARTLGGPLDNPTASQAAERSLTNESDVR